MNKSKAYDVLQINFGLGSVVNGFSLVKVVYQALVRERDEHVKDALVAYTDWLKTNKADSSI